MRYILVNVNLVNLFFLSFLIIFYIFSIIFIRREKQSDKQLVLVVWVQTEERNLEDAKDELETMKRALKSENGHM